MLCYALLLDGMSWAACEQASARGIDSRRTVLLVRLVKDGLVVEELLDLGEQGLLLVIVVRLDELKPGQGVADEVGLVRVLHVWCLQVDAVVSSKDGIVQQGHMCRTCTKEVGLRCGAAVRVSRVVASHRPRRTQCSSETVGWMLRTFLDSYWGVATSFMG